MKLDYSIPQFQLLIGSFNATDYLDEIALSLPMHEITQKLSWSGRFKVSFNRKAIAQGLTADQFDQGATPIRWRPGQQPVRLYIKGYPLPVMRIDRYAYNPQTGIGEGSLHQIIDAVATDRPATKGEIEIYYTPLDAIVNSLLSVAFRESTVNPGFSVGGLSGQLLGGFVTRNPIADAQKLLGTQWRTLTVDTSEVTRSHYCGLNNALFFRTLNQIEIEPDIDHINFAASRIIVTGSRQVPKKITPVPGSPKPKLQKTEENLPYTEVYPGSTLYTTPQTFQVQSEKKQIHYQYQDDDSIEFYFFSLVFGGVPSLGFELQSRANRVYPGDNNKAFQVVTVKEWPKGRIKSLGDDSTLAIAQLEVQTETRRRTWVPKLLVVPTVAGQPEDYSLVLKKDEKLTTPPTTDNSNTSTTTDTRTGKPTILEPKAIIEGQKPIADQPMETEPILGVAEVSPAGWSPIAPNDQIIEVGFLPDKDVAAQLAQNIAVREARRRDSMAVTMPIPDEWLIAGCPILPTVVLWDGAWLAEGLIVSMQGTEAKFAFTAARISRAINPALPPTVDNLTPVFSQTLEIVAAALMGADIQLLLIQTIEGSTLAGDADITLELVYTTLPPLPIEANTLAGAADVVVAAITTLPPLAITASTLAGAADLAISIFTGIPLVYASNGDADGLFYYRGSLGGTIAWANPGANMLLASSIASPGRNETLLSDRVASDVYTNDSPNSWFAVDVGAGSAGALAVTDYIIRARSQDNNHLPRNWVLQGTNTISAWTAAGINGATWATIDTRAANTTLANVSDWGHFALATQSAPYRYIRFLQTGLNSSSGNYLTMGEMEFYGNLT